MDKFVIDGPTPLRGSVSVHGAKNAVLPLMAAALLARGKSVIENVPDLRDVGTMVKMLDILGAVTTRNDSVLTIDTTHADGVEAPYDLVRTMRASIYVLGADTRGPRTRARQHAGRMRVGTASHRPPSDGDGEARRQSRVEPRLHRGELRSPARRRSRVSDLERGGDRADHHGRFARRGNFGDRKRGPRAARSPTSSTP